MGAAAQKPTPPVDTPEMRQQAYQQLLAAAASRNDAGDSSQMMADILNAVDMGRAGRVTDRWATRNAGRAAASTTMLDEYAKALAAARAKAAASARRASGGGGGSAPISGMYTPGGYEWPNVVTPQMPDLAMWTPYTITNPMVAAPPSAYKPKPKPGVATPGKVR